MEDIRLLPCHVMSCTCFVCSVIHSSVAIPHARPRQLLHTWARRWVELYEDEVLIFPERRQQQPQQPQPPPPPPQQQQPRGSGLLPPRHPSGPASTSNGGSGSGNVRPKASFPITADSEVEETPPGLRPHSFCLAIPVSGGGGKSKKPKVRRLYLAPEAEEADFGAGGAEVERLAWMELMGAAISIAR